MTNREIDSLFVPYFSKRVKEAYQITDVVIATFASVAQSKLMEYCQWKVTEQAVEINDSEIYYRTMSQEDYDYLKMTGELPSTGETFISPTSSYSENYDGVLVKFERNSGTTSSLEKIGLSNGDRARLAREVYPDMPYVSGIQWNEDYAFLKQKGHKLILD